MVRHLEGHLGLRGSPRLKDTVVMGRSLPQREFGKGVCGKGRPLLE